MPCEVTPTPEYWFLIILTGIHYLAIHLKSFGTPAEDCTESAEIYEDSVARRVATLVNAQHANTTPVAWQPDRQRLDPPLLSGTTRPRSVHSHFSLPYCIKRFIEPHRKLAFMK